MAKTTKARKSTKAKKKGRAGKRESIRRVSLKQVGALAARRNQFWNALRKNPAEALRASGMRLFSRELARLNRLVRANAMTITVRDLNRFVRRAPGDLINEWAEVWIRDGERPGK